VLLVVSLVAPSLGAAQPSPGVSLPIGTQAPPSGATMRPAQPTVTPSLAPTAAPVGTTVRLDLRTALERARSGA